jgi:peptide/nickel transport system permease protein
MSGFSVFRRNRAAGFCALVLFALISLAAFGPALSPFDPDRVGAGPAMAAPSLAHPMGTDDLGRDVFSRALIGLRVSLFVGIGAASFATLLGVIAGGTAGFFGGRIDDLIMRVTEVFQVIPRFFLAILLVAFFGASILNILVAIAVLSWPEVARVLRSDFLSLRARQFVDAARLSGASNAELIFVEILPNALGPVVVNATLQVGQAMLLEAGLSYLGLGDPSQISLGVMMQQGQQIMRTAWWATAFPGLLVFLAVFSLNVAGDGLNDVLNPRSRDR